MTFPSIHDPELTLLTPDDDVTEPEVTILVPSLNEELTIGTFVDWCREGIAASGAAVEILIVDSSTDRTPEIARDRGARVLRTPKRGLGRAYIDAIPFVRGKFIIMGDADCTYDFRQITPFIEAFRNGNDFVMGSRFKGSIEDNAMPPLHRYFGTPLTTWILNRMFASRFSDIHCGMRGISVDALLRMDLRSQGWEYASEMVLKSVHMELPTTEVPIHFLKDPDGRLSHMKRRGWMEPWRAGWRNLQAMFVYGFDFFLIWPGFLLLALGLIIMLPLLAGPMSIAGVRFSSNAMLFAMALAVLGQSMLVSAAIGRVIFDYSGRVQPRFERLLPYNATIWGTVVAVLAGVLLVFPLFDSYVESGYVLPEIGVETNWAVFGLWLITTAFQIFISGLMIRALGVMLPIKKPAPPLAE
ncbi:MULTISPECIES: glycosyltransferase family 2 protein [Rhizobium]|uniref:glycosyltransferase family 2 protein n=1 Tax=Rhizobium TaxID=379 RepID=UPI001C91FB77|nr:MULTISPECIES: glycosyltransferase family 2 protein [Rhizobium]MBY3197278.1 glycosyltransferase family 2 protein [Rhizobium laguerreae]MBY3561000.1 glycosyltransferase family 2 protein [Rhizobium laguerreae]MBY5705193.1 glycosyltransferase family 2 protein [Rhizobium leguminosarum]